MRYVPDNPQIAIRIFDLKIQKLISRFLKAKLNSSFHYFRCEFQQCGSVHILGLAKLNGSSDLISFANDYRDSIITIKQLLSKLNIDIKTPSADTIIPTIAPSSPISSIIIDGIIKKFKSKTIGHTYFYY